MRKVLVLILLISVFTGLYSAEEKVMITSPELNLILENIKIKDIKFHADRELIIKHKKSDDLKILSDGNNLSLIAPQNSKIKLILPDDVKYLYKYHDVVLEFSKTYASLQGSDGDNIFYRDGELTISDKQEEKIVKISSEGIYVNDQDEKVEISSEGILVDSEDEHKHISGFWGKLMGGFIKLVMKTSFSLIGDDSSNLAKHIINDLNSEDDTIFIDLGSNDKKFVKDYNKTVYPLKDTELFVRTYNGKIEVSSWDKEQIEINAEIIAHKNEEDLEKISIEIDEGKEFNIETKFQDDDLQGGVNYQIMIPRSVNISQLRSSNGKIEVEDCSGNMKIITSNGKIEVEDCQGDLELHTTNGRVEASGITGELDVYTSNAQVEIDNAPGLASITTSNATVEVNIQEIQNDVSIKTSNGSVKIYLAENCNVQLSANTSNAYISTEQLQFKDTYDSDDHFEGKLGSGKHKLDITTSNASIKIYKL